MTATFLLFECYKNINCGIVDQYNSLDELAYDLEYWYVDEDYLIFDTTGQIIKLRLGIRESTRYDPPVEAYETGEYDLDRLLDILKECWASYQENPYIKIEEEPDDFSNPASIAHAIFSADLRMTNPVYRAIQRLRKFLGFKSQDKSKKRESFWARF